MGIAEVAVPPISLCSLSAAASRTKSSGSNGNSRALPRPPILIRVKSNKGRAQNRLDTRRDLMTNALLALLGGLLHSAGDCKPTQAFSFGISGPKEWLREQKKKTIYFLLGPIIASRDRLNRAYHLLSTSFSMTNESEIPFNNEYEEARRLVKVAARDCIPLDEGSFVAFQANTGVEVCTFRLVLKNAASLLDDMDPIKLKANASLNDLTRSFVQLDGLLAIGKPGVTSKSEKLASTFMETIAALDKFEISIRDCLGI